MRDRLFRAAPWLLAVSVWLSALLIYAHASLTARWAGHWPVPGAPDPAATPFPVLDTAATLVFFVAYAVPLLLLGWVAAHAMLRRVWWAHPGLAVCAASWAAWFVWAFLWDPGSLVSWFLD